MSDSETEAGNVQRDALGIVVFALATFASISVGMSIWRPVEVPSGALARAVAAGVDAIGVAPLLCFTLGLALLGAGTWLFSRSVSLRDCAGLLGCAIGLSILLGAVTTDAGGLIGALGGGKVTAFLSYLVGVPFGLACLLLPAWLAWGRPQGAISWNLGQDSPRPAAPPASEVEGVSPAEAEALLPRIPPRLASTTPPPSPYPPDVRLQGRIPEGAKPIYLDDDPRPAALPDPDLEAALLGQPAEGLETASGPARAHLARPDTALETPRSPLGFSEDGGERRAAEEADRPLDLGAAAAPIALAESARPTWEQSSLFAEEPVDAYGTPLSILRTHRSEAERSPVVEPPDLPSEREISLAERALADLSAEEEDEEDAGEELAVIEEDLDEADEEAQEDEDEDEDEEYEEDESSELEALEEGEPTLEDGPLELEESDLELEPSAEGSAAEVAEEEDDDGPAGRPLVAAWEAESEDEELEDEPLVELVPQPTPSSAAPLAGPTEDLVRRAAALFLERQRVAVSLLQREFDLDFEQSTAVLDRLQAQGLIGPYLGGQRREILMSAAEWERRSAAQ